MRRLDQWHFMPELSGGPSATSGKIVRGCVANVWMSYNGRWIWAVDSRAKNRALRGTRATVAAAQQAANRAIKKLCG